MTKHRFDSLVSSLSALALAGLAACGSGGDGSVNIVEPGAVALSVGDVTLEEGNDGSVAFDFAVTLSGPHTEMITVDFATGDGTAQDENGDNDYVATSGTLALAPGSTAATVQVMVNGDGTYEANETFTLTLSNLVGANVAIEDGEGVGTILADDFAAAAEVQIDSVALAEGNGGPTTFLFTVSLSAPLATPVTVDFATVDGTAESEAGDGDYQATSGMLTFEPGMLEQPISVVVNGDTKVEVDEVFLVELSHAKGGSVGFQTPEGIGSIQNEDSAGFSVTDVALTEPDFLPTQFDFTVSLTAEHTQPVTIAYATADGSAQGTPFGGDYSPIVGTLFFDPGVTQQTVQVSVFGDLQAEGDESFFIELTDAQGVGLFIADPQGEGSILDNDADIQLDTDPTGGASREPRVAVAGSYVYSVWSDDRNGNPDVYFSASSDAGGTWLASDVRVDTDTPGSGSSTGVELCADGASVYVVWQDDRNGQRDVYFNYSQDFGLTWQASDLRLDSNGGATSASYDQPSPGSSSYAPVVACSGSRVYVAWVDDRNGRGDVYFNYSHDGGATWQTSELRLDTNAPGTELSTSPQIDCAGDHVTVVWAENLDVFSNVSADGGVTWLPSQVRVDRDPSLSPAYAGLPQVMTDGQNVYVVWEDSRDGSKDVYFNASSDGGASFAAADVRLDTGDAPGAHDSLAPRLSADGMQVYVVWEDERDGLDLFGDIYFNGSGDGGASWLGETRLNLGTNPGKAESTTPQIACQGQDVTVVWSDALRDSVFDVYVSYSTDGGHDWLRNPVRLNGDGPGMAHSTNPQLDFRDGQAYVVWQDERYALDVFFRALTLD